MKNYHLDYLRKALAAQPAPPCESCAFAHECLHPDLCAPYCAYVETGKAVKPPIQLPTGECDDDD